MKKIMLLIIFQFQAILTAGELTSAMVQAKREGVPLMVMVKSQNCPFCAKMTNITLKDPRVEESIKDFKFIKVDQEDADTQRFLGKYMTYAPTIFFLSKYKILNKAEGYLSPDDFLPWVEDTKRKLGMNVGTVPATTTTETTTYERSTSSIDWMYDIPSAVDYATQTGKQILLFVSSSRSKWSQKLERETLVDANVKEALRNFVWVKVKKRDAGLSSYGLYPKSVPTVYFMTSKMRELVVSKGFFDANDFLKYINYAKSKI